MNRPIAPNTPCRAIRQDASRETRERLIPVPDAPRAEGDPLAWLTGGPPLQKATRTTPVCDTHGTPKRRLKRAGWRCNRCHAERTQAYRDAMTDAERKRARKREQERQRERRRDPVVREKNRQYQRDLRAARRTT